MSLVEREYHIPRDSILTEYTWEDVQNRINWLPSDRIVDPETAMVKKGKQVVFDKHKYKENYLQALCDRVDVSIEEMRKQAEAFEKRLQRVK